jgi:hypothetical protein
MAIDLDGLIERDGLHAYACIRTNARVLPPPETRRIGQGWKGQCNLEELQSEEVELIPNIL